MNRTMLADTKSQVRPDIITEDFLRTMREHGVTEAYLFGSFARGEERPDSDIDLFVAFAQPGAFGEQFLLAEALQRISGRRVDVTINLHPAFARYILPTLVPLPL